LGAYIAERRKQLGFNTRNGFADHVAVDRAVLLRLENGQQEGASPENLARIAQGLGLTVDELRAAAAGMSAEEYAAAAGRPTFAEFVEAEPNLTARQKRALIETYEAFVASPRSAGAQPSYSPPSSLRR
jgi:transcriptional regulator with XRE-family HTH domain